MLMLDRWDKCPLNKPCQPGSPRCKDCEHVGDIIEFVGDGFGIECKYDESEEYKLELKKQYKICQNCISIENCNIYNLVTNNDEFTNIGLYNFSCSLFKNKHNK